MAGMSVLPESTSPDDAVPGTSTVPVWARIEQAWRALSALRRMMVGVGVAGGLGIALAAARLVPVSSAVAIGAVSLFAGAAAVVDVHEHRIPNRLLGMSLLMVAIAAVMGGVDTTADVTIGLLIGSVPLFVVRYGKGVGLGDVKFAAVLGAAGGLLHPGVGLVAVWAAALASGLFVLTSDRTRLALAPWLWAGYVTACAAGVAMVQMGGVAWPARF